MKSFGWSLDLTRFVPLREEIPENFLGTHSDKVASQKPGRDPYQTLN